MLTSEDRVLKVRFLPVIDEKAIEVKGCEIGVFSAISTIEIGKLLIKRSEVIDNVKKFSIYIDYGARFGERS